MFDVINFIYQGLFCSSCWSTGILWLVVLIFGKIDNVIWPGQINLPGKITAMLIARTSQESKLTINHCLSYQKETTFNGKKLA